MRFQILAILALSVQDSSQTLFFPNLSSSSSSSGGLLSGITGIVSGITSLLGGGGGSSDSSSSQATTQKVQTTTTTTFTTDSQSDNRVNLNSLISSVDFVSPSNRRRRPTRKYKRRSQRKIRRNYNVGGIDALNQAAGKQINIFLVPPAQKKQYNINNYYNTINVENNQYIKQIFMKNLQRQNITQVLIDGQTVPIDNFVQIMDRSGIFRTGNEAYINKIIESLHGQRNVFMNGIDDGEIEFDGRYFRPGEVVDIITGDSQDSAGSRVSDYAANDDEQAEEEDGEYEVEDDEQNNDE